MLEIPIYNQSNISNISFQSKHKKTNKEVENDTKNGMKTGTKLLLGTTALAAVAVAGIMAAKAIKTGKFNHNKPYIEPADEFMDKFVVKSEKNPCDMSQEELLAWGKEQALKLKEIFGEKRDMSQWQDGVFKEGKATVKRETSDDFIGGVYEETICPKCRTTIPNVHKEPNRYYTATLARSYNSEGEPYYIYCCNSYKNQKTVIANSKYFYSMAIYDFDGKAVSLALAKNDKGDFLIETADLNSMPGYFYDWHRKLEGSIN